VSCCCSDLGELHGVWLMNNYKTEDKRGSLMKYQRYLPLLALFWLFSAWLPAQELIVTASKDDWEEINFEFNSHILTDGFPSLLSANRGAC
jgi:hypothetical protein